MVRIVDEARQSTSAVTPEYTFNMMGAGVEPRRCIFIHSTDATREIPFDTGFGCSVKLDAGCVCMLCICSFGALRKRVSMQVCYTSEVNTPGTHRPSHYYHAGLRRGAGFDSSICSLDGMTWSNDMDIGP